MKKYFLGAAAALALASPGIASAETTAEVGVSVGNIDFNTGDADTIGLRGAFSHQSADGLTLQVDGDHTRLDGGGAELGHGNIAVSLGMRNDNHAVYGFIGMSDIVAFSSTNLGIGGQLFLNRFTVNGSFGYAEVDTVNIELTSFHVDGTYFFTDNFGIGAELGSAEFDGAGAPEWTTLGVNGVYRFAGSPFAINASYKNQDFDAAAGDADVFSLGFTYNIGTDSEIERSRSGASFNASRVLNDDLRVIVY